MLIDDLPWAAWLLPLALLLWLGARAERWLHGLRRAREGRRHQQDGAASEREAARWLERQGYRVMERQPTARYELQVEGQSRPVEISADLRVHDGREEWIVEVKTGERGSRVGFRGTRRQLLEYQLAFGTRGVMLVDPARGALQQVRFPFASSAPTRMRSPGLALWVAAAAAAALAWALAAR